MEGNGNGKGASERGRGRKRERESRKRREGESKRARTAFICLIHFFALPPAHLVSPLAIGVPSGGGADSANPLKNAAKRAPLFLTQDHSQRRLERGRRGLRRRCSQQQLPLLSTFSPYSRSRSSLPSLPILSRSARFYELRIPI